MKVLAYTPCHYGVEYLSYSMQSIKDHVDHILVIYSSRPTYSHMTNLPNPDSKEDIQKICDMHGAELWDVTAENIGQENIHRDRAFYYAVNNQYDIVVAVDYDEIWKDLDVAIEVCAKGSAYQYGIRGECWFHFWKGFDEVNKDGFSPIRLFNLNNPKSNGEELIVAGTVYHFGYAISRTLMEYKISVHGHKTEFGNWVDAKWKRYEKGQTKFLHPATEAYWIETEPFDKTTLPDFMKSHPFYGS